MASGIPKRFVAEFMKSDRLKALGGTNGTRPVDLRVFKAAIQEVLSNKAFMEQLVNASLKQGSFRL